MLVLSRKKNECIRIGDDIRIKVGRIGPNSVRLLIDAPREMNIVREELEVRDEDLRTARKQFSVDWANDSDQSATMCPIPNGQRRDP